MCETSGQPLGPSVRFSVSGCPSVLFVWSVTYNGGQELYSSPWPRMKTKLRQEVGRKLAELEKEESTERRIETVTIRNSSFLFQKTNMHTLSLYNDRGRKQKVKLENQTFSLFLVKKISFLKKTS